MTKEQARCVIEKRDRLMAISEKRAMQIAKELERWIEGDGEPTIQRVDIWWYIGVKGEARLAEVERDEGLLAAREAVVGRELTI